MEEDMRKDQEKFVIAETLKHLFNTSNYFETIMYLFRMLSHANGKVTPLMVTPLALAPSPRAE